MKKNLTYKTEELEDIKKLINQLENYRDLHFYIPEIVGRVTPWVVALLYYFNVIVLKKGKGSLTALNKFFPSKAQDV